MSSSVRQITLFDRGAAQFQAYVNMCIVSKDRVRMEDGSYKRALYYLSMFGPKGSATSINAIFAGLTNASTIRDIYIEDIDAVALAHKVQGLSGFAPGWSCTFAEFGSNKAIHALVESKSLSLRDPSLAVKTKKSTAQDSEGKKLKQLASKDEEMSDKLVNALERHPVFFLMVPPDKDAQKLHLAYLDKRCPFPLVSDDPLINDDWATFLWDRAMKNDEVQELEVWQCTPEGTAPMIASAFWCFPDVTKMIKDLSAYIRENSSETIAA